MSFFLCKGSTRGGIGSRFPVKISRNPMNSSQFSRSRLFLLVIPSSTFFQMRALSRTVTIEQLSRKIVQRYNRACQGVLDANFQGRILLLLPLQISPEILVPESREILGTVDVPHPVSRNFNRKVAKPASQKSPARPLVTLSI